MKKSLCLNTSLTLFESDENASLESRKNGFSITKQGAVPESNKNLGDIPNQFLIGTAPFPFEEKKISACLNIRRSLCADFDALAHVYLLPEEAEKYLTISRDISAAVFEVKKKYGIE